MSVLFKNNWDDNWDDAITFKSSSNVKNQKDEHSSNAELKLRKVENIPLKKSKKSKKKANTATKNYVKKLINDGTEQKQSQMVQHEINKNAEFGNKLRDTLKGSRFRFINEQLYTTTGTSAKSLFEDEPDAFKAYHDGYRSQVQQWPLNPLDRIIKAIKKLPLHCVIADFGCGEGRLSQSVPHKVYSIDLVSSRDDIIACDMANTPLTSNTIDVAVFCLSLMGINFFDFILEANRVLRNDGLMHVAEISSRFDGLDQFMRTMKRGGFELIRKDVSHKLFYFFLFKKVKTVDKTNNKLIEFSLKPCLYKKR